jgi:hypothetical protein
VKLLLRQALPLWRHALLHHGLVLLSADTSGTWLQLSIWCNASNSNAPNSNARVAVGRADLGNSGITPINLVGCSSQTC